MHLGLLVITIESDRIGLHHSGRVAITPGGSGRGLLLATIRIVIAVLFLFASDRAPLLGSDRNTPYGSDHAPLARGSLLVRIVKWSTSGSVSFIPGRSHFAPPLVGLKPPLVGRISPILVGLKFLRGRSVRNPPWSVQTRSFETPLVVPDLVGRNSLGRSRLGRSKPGRSRTWSVRSLVGFSWS